MAKHFISPGKYVQGPGELRNLGKHLTPFGRRPLVLISPTGDPRIRETLEAGFSESGHTACIQNFDGLCSKQEIRRVADSVKENNCDIVAGIGSGKLLDITRAAAAAAYGSGVPAAVCPTAASRGTACTALSVAYDENGVFDEYLFLPSNPALVLADTEVIARSPVRLTVSGMGGALATYFETRACKRSGVSVYSGGQVTMTALILARACLETLLENGLKAKLALEAGAVTDAVEKVVEINLLLGGIGLESGGAAAAHAVQDGLTVMEECRGSYYGERLAFGTVVQLVMEDAPKAELEEIIQFCIRLGLPVTLEQLGITENVAEKVRTVAGAACAEGDTMCNMPFRVTPENVFAAILAADHYGRHYLKG